MCDYPPPQLGERYRSKMMGDYIVARPSCDGCLVLISLTSGNRYSDNAIDPFGGNRAKFVRIDENGKEIVPPIKLIEGHDYQCRDGGTTGPLKYKPSGPMDLFPWESKKLKRWYREDLRVPPGCEGEHDIVKDLGPYKPPVPKLIEGHEYELSDGRTTGPLREWKLHPCDTYPWCSRKLDMGFRKDGTRLDGLRIVKDLGPYKPPRHEPPRQPQRGDVYRRKSCGGLYMVMRNGGAPSTKLELRCVGGGDTPGNWWRKDSEDLFNGGEKEFEFIGNDCLTLKA